MITATQTPQQIVNAIVTNLNNRPSDIDSTDYFEVVTKELVNKTLTDTLCCSDTYDTILTIDNEHWLIIDETNEFSCDYLASGELLYGWTDEMIGIELTEDQKKEFQSNLEHELQGIKVVNRELTSAEKQWQDTYFFNELQFAWNTAINQTF